MKQEKQSGNPITQEETKSRPTLSNLFEEVKHYLPLRANRRSSKKKLVLLMFLLLLLVAAYLSWPLLNQKAFEKLNEVAYDKMLYRHDDQDYMISEERTLCGLSSVLWEDYREFEEKEKQQEQQEKTAEDLNVDGPWIRQRPRINIDRLMYYEELTKDRVRAVFDNGACETMDFKDLLYNIQEGKYCTQFQPIPRDGQVTEYINVLYIKSFEKVKCPSGERFRARMDAPSPSCATLRNIADCGVGLFSIYVYRKLRTKLEELNPNMDFRYRRTVGLEGCGC